MPEMRHHRPLLPLPLLLMPHSQHLDWPSLPSLPLTWEAGARVGQAGMAAPGCKHSDAYLRGHI